MKRLLCLAVAATMMFAIVGCAGDAGLAPAPAAPAAPAPAPAPAAPTDADAVAEIHQRVMPEALELGGGIIRVAVIRNLAAGDHTQQFLEGAVSEGRALGFEVDTFVTDGDNVRAQETIARVIQQNYSGIILSHGEAGYTFDSLLPAVEKGMRIVTFDSVPHEGGDPSNPILTGVTSTAQDDVALAELSLGHLVSYFDESMQPIRTVRAWMGPGIPPLDRRQVIYDRLVAEGKIVELALVGAPDFSNVRGSTHQAFSAMLPRFPEGTIDAVWGSYDELAKGCLDALNDAGRTDVKIFSIDISNDNINLMQRYPDVWLSTAAVDPKLIGISNMRLLAAKFAGEATPDEFNLDAQIVKTEQLNPSINMTNIPTIVPDWGQEAGVFDHYPWMIELKAAVAGR